MRKIEDRRTEHHLAVVLAACAFSMCAPQVHAQAGKPPCVVGTVTRAGALNYDARILEHNRAKGLYKVLFINGGWPTEGSQEWFPAKALKTCAGEDPAPVTEAFFNGTWKLFISGGPYSSSAVAPPLTIRPNGTYTWVVLNGDTINGKWRLAEKNDLKYGYEKLGTALLLEKANDGANWLVTRHLSWTGKGEDAIVIEHQKMGLTYQGYKK